jgi:hypothetical protein
MTLTRIPFIAVMLLLHLMCIDSKRVSAFAPTPWGARVRTVRPCSWRVEKFAPMDTTTRQAAAHSNSDSAEESNVEKINNKTSKKENVDLPLFSLDAGALPDVGTNLGIDLGSMLEPLSDQEAAELKAAATEVINDGVAKGIDEIALLRANLQRELKRQSESLQAQADARAKVESDRLLRKIDALTDAFLSSNEFARTTTKRAAAADQSMEGEGLEVGVWGVLNGAAVPTSGSNVLLGSIQSALQSGARIKDEEPESEDATTEKIADSENRIVVVADESQDVFAKKLIAPLTASLTQLLPGIVVDVYKPTATIPLGADNAKVVLLFLTSLSDQSSVKNLLDRCLRKILRADGAVGRPPTQIVALSTLGTERFDKMPYSMQNLMGGKLKKRREMEESLISTVRNRAVEPALDYTICKLGELTDIVSDGFALKSGDAVDGNLELETAVSIVTQAIAMQPFARNATLSCAGKLGTASAATAEEQLTQQAILDDSFLQLDGPELYRVVIPSSDVAVDFPVLVEYVREWAMLLAETGKGLTTPIRAQVPPPPLSRSPLPPTVAEQATVQLLFMPTNTGNKYLSKEEERTRDKANSNTVNTPMKMTTKEGGMEVAVEITKGLTGASSLRIRAKRCNYVEGAVLKEITESTLVNRLKEGVAVWQKQHQTTS